MKLGTHVAPIVENYCFFVFFLFGVRTPNLAYIMHCPTNRVKLPGTLFQFNFNNFRFILCFRFLVC